ncbi:hypothetical protein O6H91_13G046500 [Diphasiastrum complanatum]|uniref:Uncharacterized protein n=2 Tax=Diphasiastrum complanatum TaxID=34168 RepID=A0ACC2BUF6_DIPCM|nr:hypothetical protein O6H91_13G046500 [Diphasiastrum complanatum]KAJ7533395.1 hypothetical protein O6H91_13G046500 [Diphasiastrum complanatum]
MEALNLWNGTLTAEEFKLAALCFVDSWERLCPELPHWHWVPAPYLHRTIFRGNVQEYLVLENMLLPVKNKLQKVELSAREDNMIMEELQDLSTINADSACEYHMYTYHVIYSEVYKVPVLYFHGHCLDGRQLSWEEIQHDLPQCSLEVADSFHWTFLTQEDHPYLHHPWFSLHPCETSHLMSLIFFRWICKLQGTPLPSTSTGDMSLTTHSTKEAFTEKQRRFPEADVIEANSETKHDVRLLQMSIKEEIISKYCLTWLSFSGAAVGLNLSSGTFKELWQAQCA